MKTIHHKGTESTEEFLCAVALPPGGPGGDSLTVCLLCGLRVSVVKKLL